MLISADKLHGMLGDPGLVIIDARSYKDYSQAHIPGSVNLDLFAFHWADTTPEGIRGFGRQAAMVLSFAGVSEKNRVVFYDDVSGMLAARGVWMSRYLSHPDASMLDGGMKKWQAEGLAVESGTNPSCPAKFSGNPDPGIIAGYEHVRDNLDELVIIDARTGAEYDGTTVRAARAGHIPGAINIDWSLNLNPDGTLKPDSELQDLYKFRKDAKIVTYCQGAYRAANAYLALKKAGFENVRVYLGSWGEWGNLDLPVSRD
ncbi:MAG: sulfurtransferase [Nitrosopumilus sp. H13]|nr:MAG: sulfurtransferase [Nitrosopumilus sp. H13]